MSTESPQSPEALDFRPQAIVPLPEKPEKNYLNAAYGWKSWLLTTDHKRIALLYLITITLMFFLGGAAATLIRLELITPQGDLVTADTYNRLFTFHGVIMVWFFLVPSIPTVMGNFVIPMMLGAKDLAFPRLNLANWYTLYKGSIIFDTPMLFALGFIGLFTMGGLTGLFVAALGLDVHVHDTYFVIAHFHFIMVGGMVTGYMAALHYWWPKMSGRMYPEGWGRVAAAIIFFGFILTFFPQFVLGYEGMTRRYYQYAPEFQVLNVLSSAGASILAVGYVLPFIYLFWSLRYGKPAGPNPWGATGLEWQPPSPPPTDNFHVTPVVTERPYQYSPEGEAHVDH